MTTFKAVSALLLSLSVAACGSSSGTSDAPPEVSRIFDVTLPEGEDLERLPDGARATVEEFDTRNQLAVASTLPEGNAVYFGTAVLGVEGAPGEDGSLIEGDVYQSANFDTMRINGQIQNITIDDLDGNRRGATGEVRLESGSIVDGKYTNALSSPSLTIDGASASVSGKMDGAFVNGGDGSIGVLDGSVTIGSDPSQAFSGVMTSDKQ